MKMCHICGDEFNKLTDHLCERCFSYNEGEPSPPIDFGEQPEEPTQKPNMKTLMAWATRFDNLDQAIDNVVIKINSGELLIEDLPAISASIKSTKNAKS